MKSSIFYEKNLHQKKELQSNKIGHNTFRGDIVVKKFLITLILLISTTAHAYCTTAPTGFVDFETQNANPQKTQTILVLPLDMGYFNPYKSTYSSIMNTLSGDIINATNKTSQLRAMPLYNLKYKMKQNKLEPDYKRVITSFKSSSIIDYRTLRTMCDVLHTDKVLLVTGDFDPMQFIFKPKETAGLTPAGMIKPAYQINTSMILVDPEDESVLWENIYKKSFTINSPQTDFEHNAISTTGVKRFSQATANSVLRNISTVLVAPEPITSVDSYVINTTIRPKDGVTTKDGHSFSTVNKFVKSSKQKYTDWANESL